MNAYRFVVFPPGAAPTAAELDAFRAYSELLDRHIAYGKQRGAGGLAICCEAEPFERLRGLDPAFEELLTKWRVRGAEVVEWLPFCRDPVAWKRVAPSPPKPTKPWSALPPTDDRPAADKLEDATESEGLARIAVVHSRLRGDAYERWGRALTYGLWGAAAAALLATGGWLGNRLLHSPAERRADTIQRVSADAFAEPLTRPSDPESPRFTPRAPRP